MPTTTLPLRNFSGVGATSHKPALETAAQVWLMAGIAAWICIPPLRGSSSAIGWLPFWLIVAPLIDLAVLRRHRLAAASRAFLLVRSRRRRAAPRQARILSRRTRPLRSAGTQFKRVSP